MKKKSLLFAALLYAGLSFAQTATESWGDEFKMRKGSTDLSVVGVDKTGIFVKEGHVALKGYFVIAATTRQSATLVKLDKSFAEEYRNDFNKELKGKEFEDFYFIKDKLYLLGTSYTGSSRTLSLHAAEIDKADGVLKGEWKKLLDWQKEEKKDDLEYTVSYNSDSSHMVVVSTNEGRDKISYSVSTFDSKLNPVGKPFSVSNEFKPGTFQLEDVIAARSGNTIFVGRVYDYEEGKKQKKKFLQFKNYAVRVYNSSGEQTTDINTDIEGKWLVSSKLAQLPSGALVMAAFYSDKKKGKEINGMLVQRYDATTGAILSTSKQELNTSMIEAVDTDDDDDDDETETRKERKERERLEKIQEDEDGFSKYMRFRNFMVTADGGVVILAEKYYRYQYTSYSAGGGSGRMTSQTFDVHQCGDILMSKADSAGKISWLHVLPKRQEERILIASGSASSGLNFSMGSSFFQRNYQVPFYAGMGSIAVPGKNSISILFNDNPKNEKIMQLGQKVKPARVFRKTECYLVNVDAATGKYSRKSIFSNEDIPVAMPRLGVALGKDFYVIGKQDRMLGKTKIAVGKVAFK